jgi:lipopolysaccharide transport system ATP-binding protein
MMPIIEVHQLSKKFLKVKSRGMEFLTLRDTIFSFGRVNKREVFWALKQLTFNLQAGEVLGVIGRNGAGKSTLFKILSQITKPSTGEVVLRGRVSSLLEVGTGFHPELSGRENIFLNGAILGMSRREIQDHFSEIVEFSGVSEFLDDPVKYYSSGMYMRLAFAIAAHLQSEIMIIDEVLAVGDSEFQKQCLKKIRTLVKDEGRTVLLVSHNLKNVLDFCTQCLWLEQGRIKIVGETAAVVAHYKASLAQPVVSAGAPDA